MNRAAILALLTVCALLIIPTTATARYVDGLSLYRGYFVPSSVDPQGEAEIADTGWISVNNPRKAIPTLKGEPLVDGNPVDYRVVFDGTSWPASNPVVTIKFRLGKDPHHGYGGNISLQLGNKGTGFTKGSEGERINWAQIIGGFGWQQIIEPRFPPTLETNFGNEDRGGAWTGDPESASWSYEVVVPLFFCEARKGTTEAFAWASDVLDAADYRKVFASVEERRPIPMLIGGAEFEWKTNGARLDVGQTLGYLPRLNARTAGHVDFFEEYEKVYGTNLAEIIDR